VLYCRQIIENRPGADRQLRVFAETKSLPKVVEYVIKETETGVV